MKQEVIFNLELLKEYHENMKIDLESDFRNSELKNRKYIIKENIKQQSIKIKGLKECIKWIKQIKE